MRGECAEYAEYTECVCVIVSQCANDFSVNEIFASIAAVWWLYWQ